jgi:hypothetical protein
VTAPLIAPVIPPRARTATAGRGRGAAARCMPLAAMPALPSVPGDVVYGIGRVDASGRVADRTVIGVLGWQAGDRLTFTAAAGVVIARRGPDGMITMPSKPYVAIPAVLCRRCGLRAGDLVLLAAVPGEDALAAYPIAVVDESLRAHVPFPRAEGKTT